MGLFDMVQLGASIVPANLERGGLDITALSLLGIDTALVSLSPGKAAPGL